MKILVVGSRSLSEYGAKVVRMLVEKATNNEDIDWVVMNVPGVAREFVKVAKIKHVKFQIVEVTGNFGEIHSKLASDCDKLIVVEGAKSSGTILVASEFIERGKEVWAVPGRIDEEGSGATNFLIKNGAMVLTDFEEVLDSSGYNRRQ